jgi:hypothetical protein
MLLHSPSDMPGQKGHAPFLWRCNSSRAQRACHHCDSGNNSAVALGTRCPTLKPLSIYEFWRFFVSLCFNGASAEIRTPDLLITNQANKQFYGYFGNVLKH